MPTLERLKGRIKDRNMSYSSLANDIGISLSAFNNKINGRSAFDIVEAGALSSVLDISPEDIVYFFT